MKTQLLHAVLFSAILGWISPAFTNTSVLDTTFDPGAALNNRVWTTAVQADGKVIVGGHFNVAGGNVPNHIARFNVDGTVDATFLPGFAANNIVTSVVVQADGKVIIGGDFTSFDGTARNRIARLNADGTLDTTFDPGSGLNVGGVNSMALQVDGKVIVVGDFTSFDGTERNHIARLNADGTLDTTFDPGAGANGRVDSMALQPDGKVIIAGGFTAVVTIQPFEVRASDSPSSAGVRIMSRKV